MRLIDVGSTQDVARDLPLGSVVAADHQSAGRGRLDRRWQSPPGTALLVSFVLPPHRLASLAAGVAAAEACGPDVRLKWPNDLLLDASKLGGILVECRPDRCVVGIGINLSWAPPGAARLAMPRDELLDRLRSTLERWFAAEPPVVLGRWRELSATLGMEVRVQLPGETVEGLAEDIGPDGALIVAGRRLVAGDVVHLRPAGPGPQASEGSLRSGP